VQSAEWNDECGMMNDESGPIGAFDSSFIILPSAFAVP
jgi:hypothetical protein